MVPVAAAQENTGGGATPAAMKATAVVPRSWPPQYSVDEDGKPAGFAIDVMEEIAARAGVTVTYRVVDNFSQASRVMNRGEADLVPNSGMTPDRIANFLFTKPIETFVVSIFVRNTTQGIHSLDDLVGKRVAVVKNNVSEKLLKGRPDIHSVVHPDLRTAIFELLSGHEDALIFPEPVLMNLARKFGIEDKIRMTGEPLTELKRAIRVQKNRPELLAALDKAVTDFVGTPAYQKIYVKWYGKPAPFWTAVRLALAMGGILVIVLAGMAFWRYRSVVALNRKIKLNEEKFRDLVEGSIQGVLIHNGFEPVFVNQAYASIFGYDSPAEIRRQSALDHVSPADRERIRTYSKSRIAGKYAPEAYEFQGIRKDGSLIWLENRIRKINWEGRPCIQRTVLDITDIKRAGEMNTRLGRIIERSINEIYVFNAETFNFVQVNQGACDNLGYTMAEMRTLTPLDIKPEYTLDEFTELVRPLREGAEEQIVFETTHERKDGTNYDVEVRLQLTAAENPAVFVAVLQDITERKQAEEALRRAHDELEVRVAERTLSLRQEITERKYVEQSLRDSEMQLKEMAEKFRAVIDSAADEIYVRDITDGTNGNFADVNQAACNALGYTRDELLGMSVADIEALMSEREVEDNLEDLQVGRVTAIEGAHRRKDGTTYPISIRSSIFNVGDRAYAMALTRDETARMKIENDLVIAKNQAEKSTVEANAANRAKSEFLANMSHELRTPLNAIIGYSESLYRQVFGELANDRQKEYVEIINHAGNHLLEIINDVLDISAVEAGQITLHEERLNLGDVAADTVRLVQSRAVSDDINLVNRINGELPKVYADELRIKQILVNLLSNAVKFTPEGGEVELSARVEDDGSLAIVVADTGIGMNDADIGKALTTFGQVNKEIAGEQEGTGLGLPLTKGLIEAHGGSLEIASKIDVGTTVKVLFPKERVNR